MGYNQEIYDFKYFFVFKSLWSANDLNLYTYF
jgi:hypothetical protein